MPQYTPEQFLRICKRLPEEIKDVLFADETGDLIYDICQKYDVLTNLNKIADLVREVLIGSLDPGDLQAALGKELRVGPENTKRIAQEIDHFIFGPIRDNLDVLYNKKPAPAAQSAFGHPPAETSSAEAEPTNYRAAEAPTKKGAYKKSSKDSYRELVVEPEEEK